ncbi:DUF881 domain-containing protein [Sinanaerobacter chloroacetimidivorans]|jgi:uncharacterized protein YlxW (UPF0749 family)|uniref:DUF881 domain-containing protein n=1 Tax=Sinanaerobacter chloroacetimidivorans TaxID=2818044 RepID=A0A8J7W0R0_9FIRM|nr:DUF881 domain-containing protein [Sinanaerobacter chloroacetimidivorans]MBR0597061.1 DUF881 domain-containing protein [Sinanaerobacter chloroacetimidivorans]
MKKYSGMIVIGLLALFIGLVISIQITTTQGSDQGGLVPVAKAQGYLEELKKVRAEKDAAVQELNELEARMDKIEKEKADEDFFLKGVVSDLEKYKMASGVIDVKGPGVTVTIDDPIPTDEFGDEYSVIMLRYELLLSLVNKMKDAGAEAISINGQRIIATTEISLAGDNVNINTVPTAPPYIIKAIGNSDTIESTLTIRFGIIEQMKSYGLRIDIKKKDEIEVPRYSGILKFRYAEPVVEE